MKIRTMLGLAVVGTAAYAHKQHGGEFTLESVKQSLKDLWTGIHNKANAAKEKTEDLADKAQAKLKDAATKAKDAVGMAHDKAKDATSTIADKAKDVASTNDASGYGSSGYTPGGMGNRR